MLCLAVECSILVGIRSAAGAMRKPNAVLCYPMLFHITLPQSGGILRQDNFYVLFIIHVFAVGGGQGLGLGWTRCMAK